MSNTVKHVCFCCIHFVQGFCSELILWRVDAVGPLSKSGGVSELARINSLEISAFSNVAWIPTLLPRCVSLSVALHTWHFTLWPLYDSYRDDDCSCWQPYEGCRYLLRCKHIIVGDMRMKGELAFERKHSCNLIFFLWSLIFAKKCNSQSQYGFGVAFTWGSQLLLGSDTICFCPEQFSAIQCCHVLSFSQGKWMFWES